jgi:hypothetical protein
MAPYRELIGLSYVVQGSHAMLSGLHAWFLLEHSAPVLNAVFLGFNAWAFISAANWRATLRSDIKRTQRMRDYFRR